MNESSQKTLYRRGNPCGYPLFMRVGASPTPTITVHFSVKWAFQSALKNVFSLFILFILLISCGNKRSPTGGPIDNIPPEIVYTVPLEYEQIENNEIVIAFSKSMDRSSVINGLVVSPPQLNKRLSWKRNSLHIQFTEELPKDTNLFVYLNQSIRCERNNTLAEHTALIFRNGELQRNSFSGYINIETHASSLQDENFEIANQITQFTLFDSDSLLVFNKEITGQNYSFEYLNSSKYSLRAYIDTNNNSRYDFGVDPFFRTDFELPTNELININLVVADTVRPNLRNILNPANNQIVLNFNKNLAKMPFITVVEDSTLTPIDILHKELLDTQLFVLTAPMDTLRYTLKVEDLIDLRGNERQSISTSFDGNRLSDTASPLILNTSPRNGSVISNALPEISISFSEIIFKNDVFLTLKEVESGQNINLTPMTEAGFTLLYRPQTELREFNSYQLIIHKETKDIAGNEIEEDFVAQFIVIGG